MLAGLVSIRPSPFSVAYDTGATWQHNFSICYAPVEWIPEALIGTAC
jgi:hypothetical protein